MAHTRPRILIVDHDVDNREMLPVWLDREQDRFEICTASSCREAREMIIRHRFDVYILDYLMPDVTGGRFLQGGPRARSKWSDYRLQRNEHSERAH